MYGGIVLDKQSFNDIILNLEVKLITINDAILHCTNSSDMPKLLSERSSIITLLFLYKSHPDIMEKLS